MEVPDTDTAVFTQMEQTGLEGWNDAENETVQDVPLVRRDVELASGGTAALYALDTGEEPSAGTDELTSVSAELVLNSAAIHLGEYGTVRELAESELYHWADASEFDRIQYTQPLQISEKRFAVHLLLDNAAVGMEQLVVYTDRAASPGWIACGAPYRMCRRRKARPHLTGPPLISFQTRPYNIGMSRYDVLFIPALLQGKESEKHDHKETAHPDFTAGVVADSGGGYPAVLCRRRYAPRRSQGGYRLYIQRGRRQRVGRSAW